MLAACGCHACWHGIRASPAPQRRRGRPRACPGRTLCQPPPKHTHHPTRFHRQRQTVFIANEEINSLVPQTLRIQPWVQVSSDASVVMVNYAVFGCYVPLTCPPNRRRLSDICRRRLLEVVAPNCSRAYGYGGGGVVRARGRRATQRAAAALTAPAHNAVCWVAARGQCTRACARAHAIHSSLTPLAPKSPFTLHGGTLHRAYSSGATPTRTIRRPSCRPR